MPSSSERASIWRSTAPEEGFTGVGEVIRVEAALVQDGRLFVIVQVGEIVVGSSDEAPRALDAMQFTAAGGAFGAC